MKITYWLDYACPHSFIGKARLEDAIKRVGIDRNEVTIEYKSLEFDKDAPKECTKTATEIVCKKYYYGPRGAEIAMKRVSDWGKFEGLELNYTTARYTNTLDAHRLVKFAASKGDVSITESLVNALFKAFFTDNLELSDMDVLIDIATNVGLDKADVEVVLNSDKYENEVRADEAESESKGITGTPYCIIEGTQVVNGAQDATMFIKAIKDAMGIN